MVFQFPQTYFATKVNSETLEILFSFLTISTRLFSSSQKSFHNLTTSYFSVQPRYNMFKQRLKVFGPEYHH